MRKLYSEVPTVNPYIGADNQLEFWHGPAPSRIPTGGYRVFLDFYLLDPAITDLLCVLDRAGQGLAEIVSIVLEDILDPTRNHVHRLVMSVWDMLYANPVGYEGTSLIAATEAAHIVTDSLRRYYLTRLPEMFVDNPSLELVDIFWNSPNTLVAFYC